MALLMIISLAASVNGQGRGNHRSEHARRSDHHNDHYEWKKDKHNKHHHYHDREVRHHHRDRHVVVHDHDHYCSHRPVVVRHYQTRPRYIYYEDYDVYYDMHQSVYISWSGRNWSVSASLPVALHHVDRRRAVRMEVDYYEDDFTAYLASGRPAYRRVYTGL